MRLFLAVNFQEEIKNNIMETIQGLKAYASQGNFTLRENLHLTLVFLGEIAPDRVESIRQVMNKVQREKFELSLSGLGYFPRNGGNIYWLGVDKNKPLAELQKELQQGLIQAGFSLETREFKPHLTLCREVKMRKEFDQSNFSANLQTLSQQVEKISLMKSERIRGKLTYTEIASRIL